MAIQEVGKIYANEKGCGAATRKTSMELYDIFSKHLNIVQIHMFSNAYLASNTPNLKEIIQTFLDISHNEEIVKKFATEHVQDIYAPAIRYMDTHRS